MILGLHIAVKTILTKPRASPHAANAARFHLDRLLQRIGSGLGVRRSSRSPERRRGERSLRDVGAASRAAR